MGVCLKRQEGADSFIWWIIFFKACWWQFKDKYIWLLLFIIISLCDFGQSLSCRTMLLSQFYSPNHKPAAFLLISGKARFCVTISERPVVLQSWAAESCCVLHAPGSRAALCSQYCGVSAQVLLSQLKVPPHSGLAAAVRPTSPHGSHRLLLTPSFCCWTVCCLLPLCVHMPLLQVLSPMLPWCPTHKALPAPWSLCLSGRLASDSWSLLVWEQE